MTTTQYGIGVTKNRFELSDIDDEDPLEVLKSKEQEKEARKKTKLCEKENKGKEPVVKPKPTSVPRKGIKETQNLKPQEGQKGKDDNKARINRVERPERKFSGDTREDRINRRNREDRPQQEFHREERGERVERKEFRGERGPPIYGGDSGGESRGRGRGGRGGFPSSRGVRGSRGGGPRSSFDSRGKREYDRQSGSDKTGVKPVDKREGSGAHNWGNHRDDIEDMRNTIGQPSEEITSWPSDKPEGEILPETNGTINEGEEPVATIQEEERKELTLDEWKALKAPRQKPTYNLRKAGEGEDPSQWKKMYALQKKKDGEDEEGEDEYEYESCDYPQRVGRQKHIDIDIHFKDTRGGGRGRGGRGAGRGGPRMGSRGNSNPPAPDKFVNASVRDIMPKIAPKVDDEHDFPSLG